MRFLGILLALLMVGCAHTAAAPAKTAADRFQESSAAVLKLQGAAITCTAFHIGNGILVSAAHCNDPLSRIAGVPLVAKDKFGLRQITEILATDVAKDLMILRVRIAPQAKLSMEDTIGNSLEADQVLTVGFPRYMQPDITFDVGFYKGFAQYKEKLVVIVSDATSIGYSGGPIINVRTGKVIGVQHLLGNKFDEMDSTRPEMRHDHWLGMAVASSEVLDMLSKNKIKY